MTNKSFSLTLLTIATISGGILFSGNTEASAKTVGNTAQTAVSILDSMQIDNSLNDQRQAVTETSALEQGFVHADIDVEQTLDKLQQQLTDSIRQQASNAISSLADSIRTMMQ